MAASPTTPRATERTRTSEHAMLFAFALGGDARLPTGGHTQSAGLEPALSAGMPPEAILAFVRTRLATVVRVDAGAAVVALFRLQTGSSLQPVEDEWAARTPSAALREAAIDVGRGYARLLRSLGAECPRRAPRPLAMAHYAHHVGLDARALATLVGYDDVQSVLSAVLKLEPLDPARTVAWALDVAPAVDDLAESVCRLTEPQEIPADIAPLLEQWHVDHSLTTRRLFRA